MSQLAGPWSGDVVLMTPNRSQRWQHAVKPDIDSELRFLPTLTAFDAPVIGVGEIPVRILPCLWYGNMFIRFDRIDEHDRRTDTPHDGWGRACIGSRGKNPPPGFVVKQQRRTTTYRGFCPGLCDHLLWIPRRNVCSPSWGRSRIFLTVA